MDPVILWQRAFSRVFSLEFIRMGVLFDRAILQFSVPECFPGNTDARLEALDHAIEAAHASAQIYFAANREVTP